MTQATLFPKPLIPVQFWAGAPILIMLNVLAGLTQPVALIWLLLVGITVWLLRKQQRRAALATGTVALLMNIILILGIMAALNATFTLPGVAAIPDR